MYFKSILSNPKMSQTPTEPKITLKKPEQPLKLYQLKLAFRSECYSDINKVISKLTEETQKIEDNTMKGYIGEYHTKQGELGPGIYIPDFDVPNISFRIWVKETESPANKMSQLIKRFLDSIEAIPNTHVIRGSIDYQSRYDGSRDYRLQIDPKTNLLEEIDQYLEKLS